MSENKPTYKLGAGYFSVAKIDTESGVVTGVNPLSPSSDKVVLFYEPPDESAPPAKQEHFEPIKLQEKPSATAEFTVPIESAFGLFSMMGVQYIVKLATKKGDFYAPMKSYSDGVITLDIPDDEAAMWAQSEYWRQKLEQQEGAGE